MISSAEEFVRLRVSDKHEEYERAHLEEAPNQVWLEVIEQYPNMRFWVAHNRTVSLDILRILARDKDPAVRRRVAEKRKIKTDLDLVQHFSQDADEGIRGFVASMSSVPKQILEQLAHDPSEWVREAAIERLNMLRRTH